MAVAVGHGLPLAIGMAEAPGPSQAASLQATLEIERLFAWLQSFRRLETRWNHKAANFLGFLQLGCSGSVWPI